jgi:dihydrofolate reductase
MGKLILDMAMSLDGFISGHDDADSGLHDYFFSPSSLTAQVIEEGIKNTGVIIMGRGAYEMGAKSGGFEDSPYDAPNIVLSHDKPSTLAKGAGEFLFVDSLEKAMQEAQRLSPTKDIVIGGGAKIAQAFLQAGMVEELDLHIVPIVIGTGKRLFAEGQDLRLERLRVIDAPDVLHIRYRLGAKA